MKPIPTADGSLTCFHPESGELYHNKAGAYTEARENYVLPSGAVNTLALTGQLRLLDVCYGLGYNTWVLINELLKDPPEEFSIAVTAIERNEETLAFLPHVFQFPAFDILKSKTAPLEHNTYYRTLESLPYTKGGDYELRRLDNNLVLVERPKEIGIYSDIPPT